MLRLVQELYQQGIITQESKNDLAKAITKSFASRSYMELKLLIQLVPCLKKEKQGRMKEFEKIIGG